MKHITRQYRPRFVGLLVILVVFVAGLTAGAAWSRRPSGFINVNVQMTQRLPRDLERLTCHRHNATRCRGSSSGDSGGFERRSLGFNRGFRWSSIR